MNGWPNITVQIGDTANGGIVVPFRAPPLPSERAQLVHWWGLATMEARALVQPREDGGYDEDAIERASLLSEGAIGWLLGSMYAGEPLDAMARWRAEDPSFNGIDGKYVCGRAVASELCARHGLAFEHLARIAAAVVGAVRQKREPDAKEVEQVRAFFGSPPESTT